MAEEVKEDTNIENVDNNENESVEEVTEESSSSTKAIDPSLEGIQFFYESNKKVINYVGGGLILIIGLFVAYKFYWLPEKEKEAANEIFWAQSLFERDSFNLALRGGVNVRSTDGDKPLMGFEQVAEEYGITATGNVAHYYAGLCLLRTGQFEKAIEHLSQYSGDDEIMAPMAIGAIGDANMELNKVDEAIKYYLKAAEKRNNNFTSPIFLRKAGMAYEAQNNFAEALAMYERILKEYGKSDQAREIEKYIARVKALGNL